MHPMTAAALEAISTDTFNSITRPAMKMAFVVFDSALHRAGVRMQMNGHDSGYAFDPNDGYAQVTRRSEDVQAAYGAWQQLRDVVHAMCIAKTLPLKRPELIAEMGLWAEIRRGQRATHTMPAVVDGEIALLERLVALLQPRSLRIKTDDTAPDELHEQIAKALNWPLQDTYTRSLPSLRELVRPVDAALADEITRTMQALHRKVI